MKTQLQKLVAATRRRLAVWAALLSLFALHLQPSTVLAQTSLFTYQGQLTENGVPANGLYDFQFTLFGLAVGGSSVAGPVTSTAAVNSGLFTVTLDFGAAAFPGLDRFLEIAAKTNGAASFGAPLSPRQQITSTPYAITAAKVTGTVPASQVSGTLTVAQIPNLAGDVTGPQNNTLVANVGGVAAATVASGANAANAAATISAANTIVKRGPAGEFTAGAITASTFSGNGTALTALDAANLGSGTLPNARLSGTYSSALTLSSPGNSFTGNGANLTTLNAGNLGSGIVPDARLANTVARLNVAQTFTADKTFGAGIQLLADNGTATAPGYSFATNADTGIFSPATNVIAFSIAGAERLRIATNGNVGIGTANPIHRFEAVSTNAALTEHFQFQSTADLLGANDLLALEMPSGSADSSQFIECTRGSTTVFQVNGNGDANITGDTTVGGNTTVGGLFTLQSSTIAPAANGTLPTTRSYLRLNPSASVTLNPTTAIADGTAIGNILILENVNATFTVTINNGANTVIGANRTLNPTDTMMLIWNGSDWVLLSLRVN